MTGAQDLDANARIINTTVDIGAYEFTTAPPTPTELGNISTRMNVGTGDNVLIGGIIVQGTAPKKVIIRAIGPGMSDWMEHERPSAVSPLWLWPRKGADYERRWNLGAGSVV